MSESQFCDICQRYVTGQWDSHVAGKAHCRNVGLRTESALQSAQRDRNGVSVSTQDTSLDFGVVEPSAASTVVRSFVLKVTTETAEFMVLEPQWAASSLRATACVIPTLRRPLPYSPTFPAASRVESKATLILGEDPPFGSLWGCASPKLVDMKTRWR